PNFLMATVLLGWELGSSIGYAHRLRLIADRLAAAGRVPELDPWARLRREPLRGIFGPAPPVAHAPAEPRLFAYLSPAASGFAYAVAGIAKAALWGEAFIPHCPRREQSLLETVGITLHPEPPPLPEAIGRASLIFHHGGLDTAQMALAMGRPQL